MVSKASVPDLWGAKLTVREDAIQLLVLQKSSTIGNLFLTILPSSGCLMILSVPISGQMTCTPGI